MLATPGNILEALDDHLVGERSQLAQAHRRRQHRQRYDRLLVLLIGANDQRILDVARKAGPHLRDLVAHILHRARHVGGKPELREYLALALERRRPDRLDARHGVDRVFERLGDVGFDDLGRGSRIAGHDEHERQAHVGHLLDAQARVRKDAEHRDADHHHGREHRVIDRYASDPHAPCSRQPRRAPGLAGGASLRLRVGAPAGSAGPPDP